MVEQIRIIMKAEFLKIAGVKTEKAFYKKYPTEEAFFKAHPEAKKNIKKAQGGQRLPLQVVGTELTPAGTTDMSSLPTASIPTAQQLMGNQQNTASFMDAASSLIAPVTSIFKGISSLGGQREEKRKARQMRKVTDLQRIASGVREKEPERKYVTPWDNPVQPDQMFPTYGVGTNALAKDGAEIQNTYAPGYLYDNLGYEPLNDSDDVNQYYYGGDIPEAQSGFSTALNNSGFGKFMTEQGGGQALGMISGALSNNSGESQIGEGLGAAA
jgi:hypothetical protein